MGSTTDFPRASVIEGVRFTAQVGVPNVIQGLFKKRELPTKVAGVARADLFGFMLIQGLVRKYGPGPFYVRVATDETLFLSDPADIEFVLGGSPEPFASDPPAKKAGMSAFQPDALTLSRADLWHNRRAFAVSVLQTGKPLHSLGARMTKVAGEEAAGLKGEIGYDELNAAFQRITRRVVFGDAAADDTELTALLGTLMSAGNKTPGKPAKGYDELVERISAYIDAAEKGSLVALVAKAPHDEKTAVPGQLIHWLFAMGDTLPANLARALALIGSHPEQRREVYAELEGVDVSAAKSVAQLDYLGGVIQEAMRLWPTTPMFGRVATEDITFPDGRVLPAGTQVLMSNLFNHRDTDRVKYADRFAPGEWATGDAGASWSFNFFSHGPQGCPGAGMSVFLGQAFLAALLRRATPALVSPSLNPGKPLPHGLDLFAIRIGLTA
ncbi:cytochrome P450 [Nocardioides sp. WS12]|uniref:cytochrome P450 n=1 Tax=Nocardioides sp. WS12 TaxID=2486272 RepID=UPI0015FC046A|nr:cytochrome P450 [Nocardioides sp. WS12]